MSGSAGRMKAKNGGAADKEDVPHDNKLEKLSGARVGLKVMMVGQASPDAKDSGDSSDAYDPDREDVCVDEAVFREEKAAKSAREDAAAKVKPAQELSKEKLQKLDQLLDRATMYSQFLVEQVNSVQDQWEQVRCLSSRETCSSAWWLDSLSNMFSVLCPVPAFSVQCSQHLVHGISPVVVVHPHMTSRLTLCSQAMQLWVTSARKGAQAHIPKRLKQLPRHRHRRWCLTSRASCVATSLKGSPGSFRCGRTA